MDISIIICTYNRCDTLGGVLQCIEALQVPPGLAWETLVVDNNSSDRTKETVERFAASGTSRVRYLFEGRQGKSYALNSGIRHSSGRILLFTDDDVLIDPHWLLNIKRAFDAEGCTGIGGKIIPVIDGDTPSWLDTESPTPFMNVLGSYDLGDTCCPLHVPTYGANMAFRREAFERYGLFSADLGDKGARGEDTEISLRFLAAGEKLIYVPDAVVFHRVQREKLEKRAFQKAYFCYGRFKAKSEREGLPPGQAYYFGVPAHLYRIVAKKWLRWLRTFEGKERMRHKLVFYEYLGRVAEYLATRKQPEVIRTNGIEA